MSIASQLTTTATTTSCSAVQKCVYSRACVCVCECVETDQRLVPKKKIRREILSKKYPWLGPKQRKQHQP